MESDGILIENKGPFAVLTLDRPAKANAMDRRGRRSLLKEIGNLDKECRAVIITGAGRHFCAGIDLRERDDDLARGDHSAFGEWGEVNLAIIRHSAIFIAAVNGTALGGGLTLTHCCDLALARENARFGMPELQFGVYPAMAGPATQLTLSRKRTAWMMFTANPVSAAEAERWGLVNKVVADSALLQEAETLARRVAEFDPAALAQSKRALDVIPSAISTWEAAFAYGDMANAAIRGFQPSSGHI